jgi:hypothetical protein
MADPGRLTSIISWLKKKNEKMMRDREPIQETTKLEKI